MPKDPNPFFEPKAPLQKVKDFMQESELMGSKVYRRLTEKMSEVQIEFAKAYVKTNLNGKEAVKLIKPHVTDATAASDASRLLKISNVKRLIDHLVQFFTDGEGNVTMDEIVRRTEAQFRLCNDPRIMMELADRLIKWRKLDESASTAGADVTLDNAKRFLDSVADVQDSNPFQVEEDDSGANPGDDSPESGALGDGGVGGYEGSGEVGFLVLLDEDHQKPGSPRAFASAAGKEAGAVRVGSQSKETDPHLPWARQVQYHTGGVPYLGDD